MSNRVRGRTAPELSGGGRTVTQPAEGTGGEPITEQPSIDEAETEGE